MATQVTDNFILYSGGAPGTDTVFGTNAESYGVTEQNYSFRGHKNCRSRGRVILNERQLRRANGDLLEVVGEPFQEAHHRGGNTVKYWQRNWYQVQEACEVFVITSDLQSLLDFTRQSIDGAAIAVVVAIKKRQECNRIWVYDQAQTLKQWYRWKRHSTAGMPVLYKRSSGTVETFYFQTVEKHAVKITETDFAGIGTRGITNWAIEAINDLFGRSF